MPPDILVHHDGSVSLVLLQTEVAWQWATEHVQLDEAQWLGEALVVEPRSLGPLLEGMQADGLTVRIDGG